MVLTLAISSVFGFSSPKVFAITNDGEAVITKNNKNERIAESIEGEYKYIAVYDKNTKTVTITKKDLDSNDVLEVTEINLGESSATLSQEASSNILAASSSTYQNTFSNYEYTKWYGTTNKWELRKPNGSFNLHYFQTYQTTQNSSYLSSFQNSVIKINNLERDYIGLVGMQALIGTLGAIFTGGLSVFLASAGFGATAVFTANALNAECTRALDLYWDVYYASTVFY